MRPEEKYRFAEHTAEPRESNERTVQTPRTFSCLEDGNQNANVPKRGLTSSLSGASATKPELTTQNIRAVVIRVFVLCGGVLMHSELRSHPRGAPALVTPAHYIAVLSELEAPCISKMEAQTAESQGMSILCSLQCTRRSAATHNQNQL